eukprot:Cvel_21671.t1-p1 / transcript=Cvel_21671.t1 / gene=Cvel_21671 / organism=Chromera_velia_CCMP2878 / gene_product=hypothetical protein / transcript_product=hypothetical protein / location=Cvel_scaffold2053:372-5489(-) / protein_length=371 / sequence_SO=supercontig / SO=protein_coding / is_pseudo=false
MLVFKRCIRYEREENRGRVDGHRRNGQDETKGKTQETARHREPPSPELGPYIASATGPDSSDAHFNDTPSTSTGRGACVEGQFFATLNDPEASLVKGIVEPLGFRPSIGGEGRIVTGPDGTLIWLPGGKREDAVEHLLPSLVDAPSEKLLVWVYDEAEGIVPRCASNILIRPGVGRGGLGRLKELEPYFREAAATSKRNFKAGVFGNETGREKRETVTGEREYEGAPESPLDHEWVLKHALTHGGGRKRFLTGTQVMDILDQKKSKKVPPGPLRIGGHRYDETLDVDQIPQIFLHDAGLQFQFAGFKAESGCKQTNLHQIQGMGPLPLSDETPLSRLKALGVPEEVVEYEVRIQRSMGTTMRPVWPPDPSA